MKLCEVMLAGKLEEVKNILNCLPCDDTGNVVYNVILDKPKEYVAVSRRIKMDESDIGVLSVFSMLYPVLLYSVTDAVDHITRFVSNFDVSRSLLLELEKLQTEEQNGIQNIQDVKNWLQSIAIKANKIVGLSYYGIYHETDNLIQYIDVEDPETPYSMRGILLHRYNEYKFLFTRKGMLRYLVVDAVLERCQIATRDLQA